MTTSNELLEELVGLTQGALRTAEREISELRADVRVLTERVENRYHNAYKDATRSDEVEKALLKRVSDLEKAHAKYIGAGVVLGSVVSYVLTLLKPLF